MENSPKLSKLSTFRDKKTRIDLKNGGYFHAVPQQWLEEDYESYLVAIVETTPYGRYGNLVELTEDEIEDCYLM